MWKVIVVRWHGIILSLTSILYGSWLLIHPTILDNYGSYEIINQMFNSYFISIAFIVCGLGKILSILINNKRLRKIAIFAMAFLWMLFGVSFVLVNMQNTVWIFAFSMALQGFGIAIREE